MADEPRKQKDAEIEPLVDESLEEVAGGGCSISLCSFADQQ